MSTIEIKHQVYRFIEKGDDKFIKMFYEMAKAYVLQMKKDKMIAEDEEDVTDGRVYNLDEARKILNSCEKMDPQCWKKLG